MRWYHIIKTIMGRWFYNKAMPLRPHEGRNTNMLDSYIQIDISVSEYMGYTDHLNPKNLAWKEEAFFAGGAIEFWCEMNCSNLWAYIPEHPCVGCCVQRSNFVRSAHYSHGECSTYQATSRTRCHSRNYWMICSLLF